MFLFVCSFVFLRPKTIISFYKFNLNFVVIIYKKCFKVIALLLQLLQLLLRITLLEIHKMKEIGWCCLFPPHNHCPSHCMQSTSRLLANLPTCLPTSVARISICNGSHHFHSYLFTFGLTKTTIVSPQRPNDWSLVNVIRKSCPNVSVVCAYVWGVYERAREKEQQVNRHHAVKRRPSTIQNYSFEFLLTTPP